MRLHKGFSLLSLIIGIATSSLLLLTIAQLSSISRANFSKNESTLQLYVDGRNAIQLLRKYVPMAGVGIEQPASAEAPNIQYSVLGAGAGNSPLPGGGAAVLKDWVYVGMATIPNSPAPPAYTNLVPSTNQPLWCASQTNLLKSTPNATPTPTAITNNFMALQGANCYYSTNPVWSSVSASTYLDGLCCANPGNATNCADAVYSCGASNGSGLWAGSVYQKLVPHLNVPTIGAAQGDTLQVYFANRGPQSLISYDNTLIPADAANPGPPTNAAPLTLYNYTFQVVNTSGVYTLQMTDAGSGKNYNVANNVEYMAVLVGESDRIYSNTTAIANEALQLPEMNRYVRFDAPNLYAYRITAVRIALVVQSNDNVLATAPATPTQLTLMAGSNGTLITYTPPQADRKLRKVFVTTIYLDSYNLPEFRMNCVPGTAGGYQLQTSGIPFTTATASANAPDLCCGACTQFTSLALCEAQRMTGGC